MRRRPPSPRALTRSLPWYALAALITVTLYWNFDAHVEAHGEPGVDLMARQEIARMVFVRAAPYAWCIRAGNNTGNRFARI